ncbi:unnamed protein product [Rotaria magnacalcarata]
MKFTETKAIETPECQHFVIGCDRNPLPGQEYCTHHVEMNHSSQINLIEDGDEDYILLRNDRFVQCVYKSCFQIIIRYLMYLWGLNEEFVYE